MAATGLGNPAGAVGLSSWEPKTWSFKARSNVSGGVFVFASGATGVVSSGTNSFIAADCEVAIDASGNNFTGIALQSTASGALVPVALEGVFIVTANGTIVASNGVMTDGNNSVLPGVTAGHKVGRALTAGASGGYCVVHFTGA